MLVFAPIVSKMLKLDSEECDLFLNISNFLKLVFQFDSTTERVDKIENLGKIIANQVLTLTVGFSMSCHNFCYHIGKKMRILSDL